jgi:hypothetical protein
LNFASSRLFEPAETSSPRLYAKQRIGLCFVFGEKALQCEEVGETSETVDPQSCQIAEKLWMQAAQKDLRSNPMPALAST